MNKQSSTKTILSYVGMGLALVGLVLVFITQLSSGKIHSDQPYDVIGAKMQEGLDPNVYPAVSANTTRRYLDLDPAGYIQFGLWRNSDSMSANELCLVQFDNPQAAKDFEQAVNNRIQAQHDIYAGYAPDQAAQMEAAIVDVEDNYALYYVGDDPAGKEAAFKAVLKGEQ